MRIAFQRTLRWLPWLGVALVAHGQNYLRLDMEPTQALQSCGLRPESVDRVLDAPSGTEVLVVIDTGAYDAPYGLRVIAGAQLLKLGDRALAARLLAPRLPAHPELKNCFPFGETVPYYSALSPAAQNKLWVLSGLYFDNWFVIAQQAGRLEEFFLSVDLLNDGDAHLVEDADEEDDASSSPSPIVKFCKASKANRKRFIDAWRRVHVEGGTEHRSDLYLKECQTLKNQWVGC